MSPTAKTPDHVLDAIVQALFLLPDAMTSDKAMVMLLAIGRQESRFKHRRQIVGGRPVGPAMGYWQFEMNGGVRGVLRHHASRFWVHELCKARGVEPTKEAIWRALENDDVLAAGIARLLLFTDPYKLPEIGDVAGAWDLYCNRTWRPGKPHPKAWEQLYREAVQEAPEVMRRLA